jgi:hypothetical protein
LRIGVAVLGSGLLLLPLAACNTGNQSPVSFPQFPPLLGDQVPEEADRVKAGLLLPLSGPAADLGQDMLRAAQMALFDAGENDFVLIPRDTRGTPEGATQAANELLELGAEILIGPLFSAAVEAVTPIAQAADVRVLAFSNVAAVAGDGTFILGFRPEEQVRRVVQYARSQGAVTFAGLAPDDAYGTTAMRALQRAVLEQGGELTETLFYPSDLADPSDVVRDVADYAERQEALEEEKQLLAGREDEVSKRALERLELLDTLGEPPFDAILIADGGDRLRSVASLLTFYDVDPATVRFLGTIRWQDDPRILGESALRGGWYAAPSLASYDAFDQRFEGVFDKVPEQLAGLAYDATALAVIVERDLGDRRFDPVSLTDSEGFAGATGLFRLHPDGLAEHGLAVLEVKSGAFEEIDPPPTRFVDDLVRQGIEGGGLSPFDAPPGSVQGQPRPGQQGPTAEGRGQQPLGRTGAAPATPGAIPPADEGDAFQFDWQDAPAAQ